jgi:prepilin-type N-terminal cleavage/methylation domain-containing protein
MQQPRHESRASCGFTVIELLVSIVIVGILISILVPSVQSARASARRVECSNHMRQLGMAMHNHHDAHHHFPYSDWHRVLLPFIDQKPLFQRLPEGQHFEYGTLEQVASADTFMNATVDTYACPSDPAQSITRGRAVSYLLNTGTGFANLDDGFKRRGGPTQSSDITDGLSQTMAVAEQLVYRGNEGGRIFDRPFTPSPDQRRRRMATTDPYYRSDQKAVFADECASTEVWYDSYTSGGTITTLLYGSGHGYNHIMPPNQKRCFNGFSGSEWMDYAAYTSTSLHPGGVYVLAGDGAVHFVSDNIDRTVWWALGTRNGNESVSTEF